MVVRKPVLAANKDAALRSRGGSADNPLRIYKPGRRGQKSLDRTASHTYAQSERHLIDDALNRMTREWRREKRAARYSLIRNALHMFPNQSRRRKA